MKLAAVTVKGYRGYKDETRMEFSGLTTLIGRNDVGKSTFLAALDLFFNGTAPDSGDVNTEGDKQVEITCEFNDLPASVVIDTKCATSLEDEGLLDQNGSLTIRKKYNGLLVAPKSTGVFLVANYHSHQMLADLYKLTNAELKQRAHDVGADLTGVTQTKNPPLRACIRTKIADNTRIASELRIDDGGDAKALKAPIEKLLPLFALFSADRASTDQDGEAQDPMKAAIKQAVLAKEQELQAIYEHVQSELISIAEATLDKVREMDPALAIGLAPKFQSPKWETVFKVGLESESGIPLNKRGSGIRRLVLISFFRAEAERAANEQDRQAVIYAVEEPETSQHPDNQRVLYSAFADLACRPGFQVILTTHNPNLARLVPLESLRLIELDNTNTRRVRGPNDNTYRQIRDTLGVITDHSVKVFVAVEGKHDISFLLGISKILNQSDDAIVNLEQLEREGKLIFIPLGGSNLLQWTTRLDNLNIPEVHIYDRDNEPPANAKYQQAHEDVNRRPGCISYLTAKKELENYLHANAINAANPNAGMTTPGDFADVPMMVAERLREHEVPGSWTGLGSEKQKQLANRAKQWLNTGAVSRMTPTLLAASDPSGEIRTWLEAIKSKL